MISIEAIEVIFARGTPLETAALRGVDLTIDRGEVVTVIGSNGAGKSTLLSILTGDVRPSAGRVVIDGRDVTRDSAPERARLVARVFQDPLAGTCEQLTIEENMALALARGRARRLGRAIGTAARALFAARLAPLGLGLEHRLRDPVQALSGGQRQALALIMATLAPASILLLDEHTAALDPRTARFVLSLTDRVIAEHGLTALMVTHSMRQALDHGTRTVMLHEGRVILDVSGEGRDRLGVPGLVAMFEAARGQELADEALLVG